MGMEWMNNDTKEKNKSQQEKEFVITNDFLDVCKLFRGNNDCSNYNPDNNGAWELIKKTSKYAILLDRGVECVEEALTGKKLVTVDPAEQKLVEDVHKTAAKVFSGWNTFKSVAKEVGAFILHVATFGI